MQHHFDVELATKYGMLEAIILNNLEFWTARNEANGQHHHDGYYWTYNSTKALAELFPYVSQRQIQHALKHLRELGIIQTGNYNKSAYDRTLWYAFTDLGLSIMQKREMEEDENGNGFTPQVQPIPDIKPDSKTDRKPDDKPKSKRRTFRESIEIGEIVQGFSEDLDLQATIWDFIEMRRAMKSPMTLKGLKLLLSKLEKLSSDSKTQIAILDQSIECNWKSVYPLKDQRGGNIGPNGVRIKPESEQDHILDGIL